MKNFITKKLNKKALLIIIIFALCLPLVSYAQGQLINPLGESDLRVVIGRIIKVLLGFSGALALLMFVWGGILWITSGGSPEKIKKGKDTLIWAVIGLVVIFTSYTLVNLVISAITQGTAS